MNLRIHRLAVAEIDREVDYYESRHVGLGAELEDEIDATFSLIVQFPEAAPQWRDRPDRRVAVLDRFPFRIPYQITQEDIVQQKGRSGQRSGPKMHQAITPISSDRRCGSPSGLGNRPH